MNFREMVTVGIDIGSLTTKAVVLDNGNIAACDIASTGDQGCESATEVVQKALRAAALEIKAIARFICTGAGRSEAPFNSEEATEMICAVKGALFYHPAAKTVIDMGAENTRVMRCGNAGRVLDFDTNDKCAAGTGVFLDSMAKALELRLQDIGSLALQARQEIDMTATCSVFAESEVVGLIAKGVDKASILGGVHKSIVNRIYGQVSRVGIRDPVVFVGGGAKNIGIRKGLEERIKEKISVPLDPQTVGALGAALIAQERSR